MIVVVPTVVNHPHLLSCLESVRDHDLLVINNGNVSLPDWVRRYEPGKNLGVAASFNYGARFAFSQGDQGVFLLNDDVKIESDINFLEDLDQEKIYFAHGYSAFYLTKTVWERVGEFDEGFWPGYYEDCDYSRRCGVAGVEGVDMPGTTSPILLSHGGIEWRPGKVNPYLVGGGSSTLRYSEEIRRISSRVDVLNRQRYISKWGGLMGYETNTIPEWVTPTEELYKAEKITFNGSLGIISYDNQVQRLTSMVDLKETEIAWRLLRPGDRVLVAGSGSGATSVALASKLGLNNVISMEASPAGAEASRRNISYNGKEFPVYTAALWHRTAKGRFAQSTFEEDSNGTIVGYSIDGCIKGFNVNSLLLDVEGAEYQVLRSMDLSPLRVLIVEFHNGVDEEISQKILSSGMRILWNAHYTPQVFVLVAVRPPLT